MQITISGQHMDVTPALKEYATEKFTRIQRHFDSVSDSNIVLHVEKNRHHAEATINTKGATLHANAEAEDMYALGQSTKEGYEALLRQINSLRAPIPKAKVG